MHGLGSSPPRKQSWCVGFVLLVLTACAVMAALVFMAASPATKQFFGCSVRFAANRCRFAVLPSRPFPPKLEIRPRGSHEVGGFLTGDPQFDRTVFVKGDESWLAARLDRKVRGAILGLSSRGRLRVENGQLKIRFNIVEGSAAADDALAPAIDLCLALSGEIDLVRARIENAKNDPFPDVRTTCLKTLLADGSSEAGALAIEMLQDPDPAVRLAAAASAGERGVAAIGAIANDASADAQVRAEAIARYANNVDADEARRLFGELCKGVQPPRVLAAIANSIGRIGGDFENELIEILEKGDRLAQVEATIALRRIGTIACVGPLLALADRTAAPEEIRALARRTVGKIQDAARGEAGRLSMVHGEGEGELSLAGTGGLSLGDES
jgi:hypothetical protein